MSGTERTIVVWCPDWPVHAAADEAGLDIDLPIAVFEKGVVHACSPAARREGVRRGVKLREAQSRCASLVVLQYNPAQDARRFEPVLLALEQSIPTVQIVRPGVVVIRAQGPARYYGGEQAAADAVRERLATVGVTDVRIGIADGPFTAEQAARATTALQPVAVVEAGGSGPFLSTLPVSVLGLPVLTALLVKLGVRALGEFAALPADLVRDRFGSEGAAAQQSAAGRDGRRMVPRIVLPERAVTIEFEPPLDRVDQIAFALRQSAERFVAALAAEFAVCTGLLVVITSERGESSTRTWLHPRSFTPLDVIDRVRWQLQGSGTDAGLSSAIVSVTLEPSAVDAAAHHETGLWGAGPDERIHHTLSRVQSMLGHAAVLTASVGGGRLAADRRVLVPWGERGVPSRAPDRPWPGALPGFNPAQVFSSPQPAQVVDGSGALLGIDDRGALTGSPASFVVEAQRPAEVSAWAGPWPVQERWWDAESARSLQRIQVVGTDDSAWLLCLEDGAWWAEARYD